MTKLVSKNVKALAGIMTSDTFYRREIGEKGWSSEKEMCLNFDAATTRFIKSLKV